MVPRLVHMPAALNLELEDATLGVKAAERARHHRQRLAIASIMADMGLLSTGLCVVELGAGNAELSLAIAKHMTPRAAAASRFLLVDKQKPRRNAEGRMDKLHLDYERVRIGIEDLDLSGLVQRAVAPSPYAIACKHLCGAASDFAIRAVAAAGARDTRQRPAAVLLGSCCHHRCTWRAYPNRRFLARLGFATEHDFDVLCRLSSRGVDPHDTSTRAHTGRLAKDLLDQGRAEFLQQEVGFERVELRTYVDGAVSPENALIVATS